MTEDQAIIERAQRLLLLPWGAVAGAEGNGRAITARHGRFMPRDSHVRPPEYAATSGLPVRRTQTGTDLQKSGHTADHVLFDHSIRVSTLVKAIADLPELSGHGIDRQALTAAALFHDAGWAVEVHQSLRSADTLLDRPTSDDQRHLGAQALTEYLADVMDQAHLNRAARAITDCNYRDTTLAEAQILAEAENLEDFGSIGVWRQCRRIICRGDSIGDILTVWDRQKEYHYWQARLKDGFRFESTRMCARHRLLAMEQYFEALRTEYTLGDLGITVQPL